MSDSLQHLEEENKRLREDLKSAQDILDSLQSGEADAIIVKRPSGAQVYSLVGPDHPYRVFIESMNECALTLSHEGMILYNNPCFSDLVKIPNEQLKQSNIFQFLPLEEQKIFAEILKISAPKKGIFKMLSSDNQRLSVYYSLTPNFETGEFNVILSDITEKEKKEKDLRTANRKLILALNSMDTFLSSMSHDLRTPLNGIMGFTDILLMSQSEAFNEKQLHHLNTIKHCSEELLRLITQLLDLGKFKEAKLTPVYEVVDINALLKQAINIHEAHARKKNLKLEVSKALDSPLRIKTDSNFLKQIFLNLIDNAIKFTHEGKITIQEAVRKNNGKDILEISIEDTGIGIREEDFNKLFQPYCNIQTTVQAHEHVGIGLYISHVYAELLGMHISCSSKVGEGSRFTLTLPLESTV